LNFAVSALSRRARELLAAALMTKVTFAFTLNDIQ
jgi:hypothetical protein